MPEFSLSDVTAGMTYMIKLTVMLIALEVVYLLIARHYGIGAPVTSRSSSTHRTFTTTGGGIVFLIAAVIFSITYGHMLPPHFIGMLAGGLILGAVSFIDDIHDLNPTLRLCVQAAVVAATYWWIIGSPDAYLLVLLLGVGFINAYNFMDGISGILVAYSLVTLGSLYYVFSTAQWSPPGIMPFIATLISATIVFGIFNFRKHSLIFCGDVGSIVMGFFILFLMVTLIAVTHNAAYIVFLMVYAVDTIFTIFERLFRGENILTPHKSHLYQILANRRHVPHIGLACIYSGIQLVINIGLLIVPDGVRWSYVIVITSLLVATYFMIRRLPASRS